MTFIILVMVAFEAADYFSEFTNKDKWKTLN